MIATLADFHFIRPLWLLFLLPAVALFLASRRLADPGALWRAHIDAELLSHLLVGAERRPALDPALLLLAAWVIGIVAVAGPTFRREPSPFADAKPPAMIVLRVTPTMQAPDLAPTRLDRARQKLADLLALREGASTGLIAYSGSPHLVLPPTADGDVVLAMARALSPDIMPKEGDDIAGALALAQKVLDGGGKGGSILVLADTVAPDAVSRLVAPALPVTILAMLPPELEGGDAALADASRALDADLVATTIDGSDVSTVASRLDLAGRPQDVAGEGQHWQEAGLWLTPILVLIGALWFRRGFVLA